MLIRVDAASAQPLHEQIAGQLRQAIADGDPSPGEKLPAARDLADGLGVNVHTLLRAFQTLRDEGLLEMRRGRGTIVTGTAPKLASITDLAKQLVTDARHAGLNNTEIMKIVETQL